MFSTVVGTTKCLYPSCATTRAALPDGPELRGEVGLGRLLGSPARRRRASGPSGPAAFGKDGKTWIPGESNRVIERQHYEGNTSRVLGEKRNENKQAKKMPTSGNLQRVSFVRLKNIGYLMSLFLLHTLLLIFALQCINFAAAKTRSMFRR